MFSLNARPDHADAPGGKIEHRRRGSPQVLVVAGQDRAQHRQLHIQTSGAIVQRPQILRQAGAAECKTGLEISLGDIEPVVLAQRVHDLARIDSQNLTQRADFIREGNLDRVKRVAGVLDHFSRAQRYQARIDLYRSV